MRVFLSKLHFTQTVVLCTSKMTLTSKYDYHNVNDCQELLLRRVRETFPRETEILASSSIINYLVLIIINFVLHYMGLFTIWVTLWDYFDSTKTQFCTDRVPNCEMPNCQLQLRQTTTRLLCQTIGNNVYVTI